MAGYRYRKLKLPDGSTRDEHRVVMERQIGRRLGFNETVHHKNGDGFDNRLENLEVLPRDEHSRRHADPERNRSPETRAKVAATMRGRKPKNALPRDKVVEIRRELAAGRSNGQISQRHGISRGAVQGIRSGRRHADVS